MDCFAIDPETIEGFKVGVYVIDDYSRYKWVAFGKRKSDISDTIISLLRHIVIKTGQLI